MSTYGFGNHFRLQLACFLLHYFLVVISLTYTSANLLKPEMDKAKNKSTICFICSEKMQDMYL